MGRTIYIIRHGSSEGNRHNQELFGPIGGALNEKGIQEAIKIRQELEALGIKLDTEPVATSFTRRAYETAQYAGFKIINQYELLNEIRSNLPPNILDATIEQKRAPQSAINAARKLLKNPPFEKIWITHGLLIIGIAHEIGYPPTVLYKPKMGTITEIEIG